MKIDDLLTRIVSDRAKAARMVATRKRYESRERAKGELRTLKRIERQLRVICGRKCNQEFER